MGKMDEVHFKACRLLNHALPLAKKGEEDVAGM